MPLTSAEMAGYTLLLLFALWILLSYSALLFVEAYQKAARKDAGIATPCRTTFWCYRANFSHIIPHYFYVRDFNRVCPWWR